MYKNLRHLRCILAISALLCVAEQSYAISTHQISDPLQRRAVRDLQQNQRKLAAKHLKVVYVKAFEAKKKANKGQTTSKPIVPVKFKPNKITTQNSTIQSGKGG